MKISKMGVGFGAAIGVFVGGWVASKFTKTPANKRILYSGAIQLVAAFLAFKKFPSIALGLLGSGAAFCVPVIASAAPSNLLDGSYFTRTALPPPEANSLRAISPTATAPDNNTPASTNAALRMLR